MSRKITLQVDLVIPDDDDAEEWAQSINDWIESEYTEIKDTRVMWS